MLADSVVYQGWVSRESIEHAMNCHKTAYAQQCDQYSAEACRSQQPHPCISGQPACLGEPAHCGEPGFSQANEQVSECPSWIFCNSSVPSRRRGIVTVSNHLMGWLLQVLANASAPPPSPASTALSGVTCVGGVRSLVPVKISCFLSMPNHA